MRRLLVVALLLTAGTAAAGRQAPQPFKSRSELVLIDVLVTHGRRMVAGLTGDDFELLDNGIPQTVKQLYFEKLPLNVILVLDTSGSVEGERLAFLKKGAAVVINRLRPSDQAAIVSFSARVDLAAGLTSNRVVLNDAIEALAAGGSTALMDAAFAGLVLRGASATRTLIVLFSDGVDTASLFGEDRVLQTARRSDATVYAIGIRELPHIERKASGLVVKTASSIVTDDRFLSSIARETGGRLIYADDNRQLTSTFARVIEEFNHRYVLGYVPTGVSAGGWHQVTVRLKTRQGTTLARRGYFAD